MLLVAMSMRVTGCDVLVCPGWACWVMPLKRLEKAVAASLARCVPRVRLRHAKHPVVCRAPRSRC